jgi:hypothetical protein
MADWPSHPDVRSHPVFIAIDETFVGEDSSEIVADVYSALGALDAECPKAVATLGAVDLGRLAEAGARWAESYASSPTERDALLAAVRRVRHLLERGTDPRGG